MNTNESENQILTTTDQLEAPLGSQNPAATKEVQTTTISDIRGLLSNIPRHFFDGFKPHQQKMLQDGMAESEQEFGKDSELWQTYKKILLENDSGFLQKKSRAQFKNLQTIYMGSEKEPHFWQIAKRNQWQERNKHLEPFRKFVDDLAPVRADANKQLHTFQSPRMTGKVNSYGPQDALVQADNYVYASFDKIGHHMSRLGTPLDESDFKNHTEIVMQDAAHTSVRSQNRKWNFMATYLTNLFDYQTGKEILAVYLASVFNTPSEATAFINSNNQTGHVEEWETRTIGEFYSEDGNEHFSEERSKEIVNAMQVLKQKTGIEPPLSLEIRIKGSARIR